MTNSILIKLSLIFLVMILMPSTGKIAISWNKCGQLTLWNTKEIQACLGFGLVSLFRSLFAAFWLAALHQRAPNIIRFRATEDLVFRIITCKSFFILYLKPITWHVLFKGAEFQVLTISINAGLPPHGSQTWRRLASSGANSANSTNTGTGSDRTNSVNVGQDAVISGKHMSV